MVVYKHTETIKYSTLSGLLKSNLLFKNKKKTSVNKS